MPTMSCTVPSVNNLPLVLLHAVPPPTVPALPEKMPPPPQSLSIILPAS